MKTTKGKSISVQGRAVRISDARSKKGLYTATLYQGGKMLWKALDTTIYQVAEVRARAWAAAVLGGKWDDLTRMASRQDAPTLGAVVDALLASGMVRDRTAREYGSALLRLVAQGLGLGDSAAARGQRVSVLSGDLVDDFVARAQGLASPDYSKAVRRGNNGINSTLANAKSAFGPKLLRAYGKAGLVIREEGLRSFLGAPRVQPEPVGFALPSAAVVRDLVGASLVCEGDGRLDLFLTTQLMLCLGLDAGEVLACRGSWLVDGALVIVARPEEGFQGKTANRGRRIAVPEHLLAYVVGAGAGFVVMPGGSPTDRWNLIYREHSEWLREWFPADRYTKTNHSLRKLGGTLVANREGSARGGAAFLGNLEATFEKHYNGADVTRGLDLSDVRRD